MCDEPSRLCARCGKAATQLCSRCLSVAFCDASCQRGAWRDHRPLCVPAATAATAVVAATKRMVASPQPPTASTGIAHVVSLMIAHPLDVDVANSGIRAIFQFTQTAEGGAAAALQAGAHVPLVDVLRHHAEHADLCSLSGLALSGLLYRLRADKRAAIAIGAIPLVCAALRAHAAHAKTSSSACSALWTLTHENPTGTAAARACGAIPLLVAALRSHVASAEVCCSACLAIYTFTTDADGRSAVLASGALPALLAALQVHEKHRELCMQACSAIANVVLQRRGAEAALSDGAVPLLVGALKTHGGCAKVCANAFTAMTNIVSLVAAGGEAAIAAGALPLLAVVLCTHAEDAVTCYAVSKAAACLMSLPAARAAACGVDNGGGALLPPLLAAMRTHAADAGLCMSSCVAFEVLCEVPNGAAATLASGALPFMIAALRLHAVGHARLALAASFVIREVMAVRYRGRRCDLSLASEALQPLIAALRAHPDDVDILVNVSIVIETLISGNEANRATAIAAGAVELLVAADVCHGPGSPIQTVLRLLGFSSQGRPLPPP